MTFQLREREREINRKRKKKRVFSAPIFHLDLEIREVRKYNREEKGKGKGKKNQKYALAPIFENARILHLSLPVSPETIRLIRFAVIPRNRRNSIPRRNVHVDKNRA